MSIKKASALFIISCIMISAGMAQTLSEELIAKADMIIDLNGNGDYTTINEGFQNIPDNNAVPYVVLVRKGVYYEKVILKHTKTNVILVGEDVDSTIITHDDWGDKMLVNGDPAVGGHTFSTYTFRADPHDFQAYNITFENPTTKGQGVAYHSNGDRQLLYHCRILGNQDTYFDGFRTRRYIKDCFVEGGTDFIFGFGVTLFDSCQVQTGGGGYTTATSTPQYYEFGHVFKDCRLSSPPGGGSFSLGRPWFPYSNTIFYECYLPETVNPGGWSTWSGREATCIYREYNNFGPGSDTTARVSFGHQLPERLAPRYVTDTILAASNFPSEMGIEVDTAELFFIRHRFEASGYIARADTILYAGRDTFPEYPTEDWSPEYYEPIYSIINTYTIPFMDSANMNLDIGDVYYDENLIDGFSPEIVKYGIEFAEGDTIIPEFSLTGTASLSVSYPDEIPGIARLQIVAYDRSTGGNYRVFLSQDSLYWSTIPQRVTINTYDTVVLEKGVYEYETNLPNDDTEYKRVSIRQVTGWQSYEKISEPTSIPGDLVFSVTSASDRTDTYTVKINAAVGVDEVKGKSNDVIILNPVKDNLVISSNVFLNNNIELAVFDLNGRLVFNDQLDMLNEGKTEVPLETATLSEGLYIYRIISEYGQYNGKFVKQNN